MAAFPKHPNIAICPHMIRAALAALALTLLATAAAAQERIELLFIDKAGCPWCARFEREAMQAYELSEFGKLAPLRRASLDVGQPKGVALDEPVRFTPTFVLLKDGRETARIVGYSDNALFFGLVERHIADARAGDRS
jgi:thioredoxin-related protein